MAGETNRSTSWDRVTLTCVTPDRGPARVLRVGAFAGISMALSAMAHGLGGGHLPSGGALALAAIPVLLGSLWLTGRRRGGPEILGALGLGQIGLHLLFHTTAMSPRVLLRAEHHAGVGGVFRRTAPTSFPPAEHGALGAGTSVLPESAGHLSLAGPGSIAEHQWVPGHESLIPSAQMLAWHILAVAVLAWVLTRGEAALWRLAQRMRLLWSPPDRVAWANRTVVAGSGPAQWIGRRVCSIRPRGPPALASLG